MDKYSIGIELTNLVYKTPYEGGYNLQHKDGAPKSYWQPYTREQFETLNEVLSAMFKNYDILDVIGHDDISPVTCKDPVPAFFWTQVLNTK